MMIPSSSRITLPIRRQFRYIANVSSQNRKKMIFLGTPSFAAQCLETLLMETERADSKFEVVAVVTKPPVTGKHRTVNVTPVHRVANENNIRVLTPEKASEKEFIEVIEEIRPDICLTAAYGNYLPSQFLSIPKFGTLNIHPSLLPKYRGASPVQRALENGDTDIGVSVLFSVKKMDAGPVLSQQTRIFDRDVKEPVVVRSLFQIGLASVLHHLPRIWATEHLVTSTTLSTSSNSSIGGGGGRLEVMYDALCWRQNDAEATIAPKITADEGNVNFSVYSAEQVHNKCRAFAEWPGVWTSITRESSTGGEEMRVKLLTTGVLCDKGREITSSSGIEDGADSSGDGAIECKEGRHDGSVMSDNEGVSDFRMLCANRREIRYVKQRKSDGYLEVECSDGSRLAIYELQFEARKVMSAKAFNNGLKGRRVFWVG